MYLTFTTFTKYGGKNTSLYGRVHSNSKHIFIMKKYSLKQQTNTFLFLYNKKEIMILQTPILHEKNSLNKTHTFFYKKAHTFLHRIKISQKKKKLLI